METATLITSAKDGYQLALAMLAILILGIIWVVNKLVVMKSEQDAKDEATAKRFDSMTTSHVQLIVSICSEHSAAVERLIEQQRLQVTTTLEHLADTLVSLEKVIEKRSIHNERL